MKVKIHPQYFSEAQVTCSTCGTTFTTGSTKEVIRTDVCSKCHPFYTGEQRFLDATGRVESFQKKQQAAKEYQSKFAHKKEEKKDKSNKQAKSLRELLAEA